jgi:CheY-like chemotaxis protein
MNAPRSYPASVGDDGRDSHVRRCWPESLEADRCGEPTAPIWEHAPQVLVVEDELIIAWHLADALTSFGCAVCGTAATVREAVRLAAETRPDLVLMDVRLRDGTGLEAGERILAQRPVPIVFCTAYSEDPAIRVRLESLGAADILPKPVRLDHLEELLGRLFPRSSGNGAG